MVGVSTGIHQITNPTSIHEDAGLIPGLTWWVKEGVLLWLWCRPAAATPIQPLAWELPYATGVALKSKRKEKKGSLGVRPSPLVTRRG